MDRRIDGRIDGRTHGKALLRITGRRGRIGKVKQERARVLATDNKSMTWLQKELKKHADKLGKISSLSSDLKSMTHSETP